MDAGVTCVPPQHIVTFQTLTPVCCHIPALIYRNPSVQIHLSAESETQWIKSSAGLIITMNPPKINIQGSQSVTHKDSEEEAGYKCGDFVYHSLTLLVMWPEVVMSWIMSVFCPSHVTVNYHLIVSHHPLQKIIINVMPLICFLQYLRSTHPKL